MKGVFADLSLIKLYNLSGYLFGYVDLKTAETPTARSLLLPGRPRRGLQ